MQWFSEESSVSSGSTTTSLGKAFQGDRGQAYDKYLDNGEEAEAENNYAFEVSWEVANKITGINTVLKSKAVVSVKEYGNNYFMVGPYIHGDQNLEFEELEPESIPVQVAITKLQDEFLCVRYGRWLIDGYPNLLLFDINSGYRYLDSWKTELWNKCTIGIPKFDKEANESLIIGFMFAKFMREFIDSLITDFKIVAHFHEWRVGIGLIMSKTWKLDIATVFTAHATLLGRYLSLRNVDFYSILDKFDIDKEAGEGGLYHKGSFINYTVGKMIALESEHFLGRKPDILTPNGLHAVHFAAMHEFQNMHAVAKEKINDFIRGHFLGSHDFDLDKTLYFFSAGLRYEPSNKGVNVFIRALHRLNHYLKGGLFPPICTHVVSNDCSDPVLVELRHMSLFNKPDDRVKVIFHPECLSSVSPLIGLDYEEFVRGCHLAVFPSYYEPWGYTPAECVVMGIPCVTSDLSGFGCFLKKYLVDPSAYGIYILERLRLKKGKRHNSRTCSTFYRNARLAALRKLWPTDETDLVKTTSIMLPRPLSAPPTPSSSCKNLSFVSKS